MIFHCAVSGVKIMFSRLFVSEAMLLADCLTVILTVAVSSANGGQWSYS